LAPDTVLAAHSSFNGQLVAQAQGNVVTDANGDLPFTSGGVTPPIAFGASGTVVVDLDENGVLVTGSYTITAPEPPAPVITISAVDSALGCWMPGYPGCPLDVSVSGSGFAPNTTYPVTALFSGTAATVSSGGVSTGNVTLVDDNITAGGDPSATVATNNSGELISTEEYSEGGGDVYVGETPLIPFTGPWDDTIQVTIAGVTATDAIDADPL
jgi:hypothetical protein